MSDRMFCVVCGGSIEIPSVRPRSDTWSHTDSSRCVAVLRAQRESLQGEVEAWTKRALLTEEAERWREAVADGLGYLNRPEGQGGYDVADPQTIVAAFRSSARDLAALRAGVEALAGEMDRTAEVCVEQETLDLARDLSRRLRSLLRPGGDDANLNGKETKR